MDALGAQTVNTTEYVADSATIKPWDSNDSTYSLKATGAIVSITTGVNPATMERKNVDNKKIKDVNAKYLCQVGADNFSFAVRVIDIPDAQVGTTIYVRPYYVYVDENGREQVVYGDTVSSSYLTALG